MAEKQTTGILASRFVLYLVIFALIFALIASLRKCNRTGTSEIPRPLDTLHSVNKAGDSVTSLKGRPIDFTVIESHIKDSIARVYATKAKNLQEIIIAQTRTITELQAQGTPVIEYVTDTAHPGCPPLVTRMRQKFANPYYTADVQIGDSSYHHLTGRDTLTALWKKVSEGNIFNRRRLLQFDISTANPDTKFAGIMVYKIPETPSKKFGIGLSAGVTWNGRWAPYAGVGLNWNIIRF